MTVAYPGRILIVDDEPKIRSFIGRALNAAGYATESADCGTDGLRRALAAHYDLVILDLVMPDLDGRQVLGQLLARVRVRLRGDGHPRGDGLSRGDTSARHEAHGEPHPHGDPHSHAEVLRAGDVTLDVGRLVADIGHGPVPLTRLEFLLLRELAEHVGQSVPKGKLLATVWGYDFDPGSNVVDVCVRRLRSKLGFELIKTVRGEGYQLVAR